MPNIHPRRGLPLDDIIEWDVRNWSRALECWWPSIGDRDRSNTRVLTVGERNSGPALWFALLGFEVTCTAIHGPTPAARTMHARHGVGARVTYASADLFALPYSPASIDIIACKSVIGGLKLVHHDASSRTLSNQALALAEIGRVLRPGGVPLAAENLRGSPIHRALRWTTHRGRLGWRHPSRAELTTLCRAVGDVRLHAFGVFGTRWPSAAINRVGGVVDQWLGSIVPASWRSIGVITAQKPSSPVSPPDQVPT